MTPTTEPFNPAQHLVSLGRRNGRDQMYLEVKWRLVWFRDEHPDWGIETKPVVIDLERQVAVFQAQVFDASGKLMASGTKMEAAGHFGDYVEKAETGAVGRALALCGYGTQFAPDLEEGSRIADAPVVPSTPAARPPATRMDCAECSAELREAQYEYSARAFGRPLCPACQKKAGKS